VKIGVVYTSTTPELTRMVDESLAAVFDGRADIELLHYQNPSILQAARDSGRVIKLIASAERRGEDYGLAVQPTALPAQSILARTGRWDMAVVYTTDYMGTISAVIEEKGPVPTSAAVLRDMINALSAV